MTTPRHNWRTAYRAARLGFLPLTLAPAMIDAARRVRVSRLMVGRVRIRAATSARPVPLNA